MFTCCEPRAEFYTARAKDRERLRAQARAVRGSRCIAAPEAPRASSWGQRGVERFTRREYDVSRYLVAAIGASTGCELRECVLGKKSIRGRIDSRDV